MKVKISLLLWMCLVLFCCQSNPYDQGKRIYEAYCASCHMEEGQGLKGLYPPLAKSDYLLDNHDQIACIIRYGLQDTIVVNGKTYEIPMMPISGINEVQITNVINYISNAWGNDAGFTKITDVERVLSECKETSE
ncbi:MAG: cytochrome c [Saprospiraceae bacterium]